MNSYTILLQPDYMTFLKNVKDLGTCCVFFCNQYRELTEDIVLKLENEDLLITEYHDMPLGEVIYLSVNSKLN
jgi:hypothetical protein